MEAYKIQNVTNDITRLHVTTHQIGTQKQKREKGNVDISRVTKSLLIDCFIYLFKFHILALVII